MRQTSAFVICSTLLATSTPAWADDWSVMVIGNPSASASSAFADSFHVADALKSAGFSDVYLYREQDGDDLAAVLDTGLGAPKVMIYFAGDLRQTDGATAFVGSNGQSTRSDIPGYLERLSQSGTQSVVLMVENCFGSQSTGPIVVSNTYGMDVLVAASDAAGSCSSDRLTDMIVERKDTQSLQAALTPALIVENTVSEIALSAPSAQTTQQVVARSDVGIQSVTRSNQDVISILPMTTVTSGATVQPVAFTQTVSPTIAPSEQQAPNPIVLPAPTGNQQAALPLREGYPQPSIIVGIIPNAQEFDRVDPNIPDVGTSEIAYDDLEARQAFRDADPELFVELVASGAFDPPQDQMPFALQNELARMNCYRLRIDGDWGNGSRSAVDQYFAQAGGSPSSREAVASLFRQVISNDDVRCPTPVAAPRPAQPSAAPSSGTRNPTPSRPAPAAPRPAPAPAPAPAPSSGGGLGDVNLGGVFRG